MSSSAPRLLAVLPDIIPSTLLCVVKPCLGLQAQGRVDFRVALERYLITPGQIGRALRRTDLVIFCRNVEPRYGYILDAVRARGIPYIYDIDDNFFAIPPHVDQMLAPEAGQYYRAPERLEQLKRYLRYADLVRVYSGALREQMSRYSACVQQVEAVVDWNLIRTPAHEQGESLRLPGEGEHINQPDHSPKVKIVYATSRRDDELFSLFIRPLRQVLEQYAWQVEMHFWGFRPAEFHDLPNVYYRKYDPNYDRYMTRFSSAGFDIGLAPMFDDDFHRAKTNNKFREYGACGIAGIYSNVPLYADWVDDSQTGLLADNAPEAWHVALVRLIQDAGLRHRLGEAAHAKVRQLYSQDRFQEIWLQQIQATLANPADRSCRVADASLQEGLSQPVQQATARHSQSGNLARILWSRFAHPGLFLTRLSTHMHNLGWLLKVNGLGRI